MSAALAVPPRVHPSIVLQGNVRIPNWAVDLESFRRWAKSDDYPERGWFSFLNGELWVDLSIEKLFSHNLAVISTARTVIWRPRPIRWRS